MVDGDGARFGKYRLLRKLGEGGFGTVYEALLPGPMGFTKRVAIKKLRGHLLGEDDRVVQALINEARIGGLLHHDNVVDILEFGQVGPHYYMAMEHVAGATLTDILRLCAKRGVRLPPFAVVEWGRQMARGLAHAHDLRDVDGNPVGLVHRDLKPSNVIVDRWAWPRSPTSASPRPPATCTAPPPRGRPRAPRATCPPSRSGPTAS